MATVFGVYGNMDDSIKTMKGHRGISNNGGFVVSPLAMVWLGRMGLLETMNFVYRNN